MRGNPEHTAREWLERVLDAERRGELLEAVDLAEQGLVEHPDDPALRHRTVLALARSGSTATAAERYAEFGLADSPDEDYAALGARIAKDEALAAEGPSRRSKAARAAGAYEEVYERTGGHYPAINAATMHLVAGDRRRSRALAQAALDKARGEPRAYYALATEAEALLLLGEADGARMALTEAASAADGDFGALATTRRQLRTICGELGLPDSALDPLAGPAVVHYCGHRIAAAGGEGRFPATSERAAAEAMSEALDGLDPGFAYGALASGADILWAEALLEKEAELHVVLPFAMDEFIRASVEPAGPKWVERFRRCMEAAREVTYAVDDAYLGDDVLYRYGAELAMGLTLLRARYLDAEVRQLALWDGAPAHGAAGTAIDVERWRARGLRTEVVRLNAVAEPRRATGAASEQDGREVRALLFGDIKGFSALTDEQVPRFADLVLSAFAGVLDEYSDRVEHQNTWGDALYVVLTDAVAGAECALELQRAISRIDLGAAGLPELQLRIAVHVGPGFPTWDPVIGQRAFMGSHVSRTARIEPVTPPGSVYVTSALAAALALGGAEGLRCDYVGHMPAAKDYGRLRMYRLTTLG